MDDNHLKDFYRGKRVLITGHTGFKGSWLTHILLLWGAEVVGVALPPESDDGIFVKTNLKDKIKHYECDIRDLEKVSEIVAIEKPDIVFHLAAQALVRRSYNEPVLTVTTNVVGTTNILEAVRMVPSIRSVVVITTDKVYKNNEWVYGYRESDQLGGYDPYSGSKAAADIIAEMYRLSFYNPDKYGDTHNTLIGIARAGNVIGGGDWSGNRLVPDIMRSVLHGDGIINIRSPHAVRPWEHVLEPLSGYLQLGMRLAVGEKELSGSWNFGPLHSSWVSVKEFVEKSLSILGKGSLEIEVNAVDSKHESMELVLDVTKAFRQLDWSSRWSFDKTLQETINWYTSVSDDPGSATDVTLKQIKDYFNN